MGKFFGQLPLLSRLWDSSPRNVVVSRFFLSSCYDSRSEEMFGWNHHEPEDQNFQKSYTLCMVKNLQSLIVIRPATLRGC